MAVGFSNTNKPINPRGNDASPKGYNRASLFSGKALDFDGVNDKVDITDNNNLDFATNFSIVQYVLIDSLQSSKIFYSNFYSSGKGAATGISDTTNNIVKFYTKGAGADNTLYSSFALNTNEWYQVIATYDGATKKIYINGQLDTLVSYTDSITYTNATPRIGALSGLSAQFFNGKMSGVKVFNTALTAAQVADLYNNPEKVVPTGVDNTALKLWLPMQEGAGTTAYDGSGNGNHGTISGATYTHGIGAPVSQTSVMNWNKGTNLFEKSEQFGVSPWSSARVTIANNIITAPDSQSTSARALETSANGFRDAFISSDTFASGVPITLSCFAKGGLGRDAIYLYTNNGSGSGRVAKFNINTGAYIGNASSSGCSAWDSYTSKDYGNGWFRFSATINSNTATTSRFYNLGISDNTNDAIAGYNGDVSKGIYFWGASLEQASSVGPYVRTGATAQTSPVLLPQGLTSGRDITGVNLFENVRKQGALNLDGNSWAEVHDNASVDVQSFTLECWVNLEFTGTYQEFLSKGDSSSDRTFELYLNNTQNQFGVLINTGGFSFATQTINEGEWYHVVATYDSSNDAVKGYVDSVEKLSTTGSVNPNNTDGDVVIGAWYDKSALKTNGQIAQPRIYNRALTAAEVLQNYNSGKNTYK